MTFGEPGLGVVIVAYEPGPVIGAVLDAIVAEPVAGVVVVDNSPTPSAQLRRAVAAHPDVVVSHRPENLGFCAGNNAGMRLLPDTDYVLFLNPDAIVEPGFVAAAVSVLETHPEAAVVGPKLVRVDETTLVRTGELDSTGIFYRWYGRPYDRGQGTTDDGRYDGDVREVPGICGAAMCCRRAALVEVAPDGEVFDESFFMHKEDIDLSWRLRRRGWSLLYAPDIVVGHVRGAHALLASRDERRRLRRRSLANEWKLLRKRDLPLRLAVPMYGYLVLKSVGVRLAG
ncbi:MAG: glycosyltransferase family 2 protein [Mycobacteriales bacterium]